MREQMSKMKLQHLTNMGNWKQGNMYNMYSVQYIQYVQCTVRTAMSHNFFVINFLFCFVLSQSRITLQYSTFTLNPLPLSRARVTVKVLQKIFFTFLICKNNTKFITSCSIFPIYYIIVSSGALLFVNLCFLISLSDWQPTLLHFTHCKYFSFSSHSISRYLSIHPYPQSIHTIGSPMSGTAISSSWIYPSSGSYWISQESLTFKTKGHQGLKIKISSHQDLKLKISGF